MRDRWSRRGCCRKKLNKKMRNWNWDWKQKGGSKNVSWRIEEIEKGGAKECENGYDNCIYKEYFEWNFTTPTSKVEIRLESSYTRRALLYFSYIILNFGIMCTVRSSLETHEDHISKMPLVVSNTISYEAALHRYHCQSSFIVQYFLILLYSSKYFPWLQYGRITAACNWHTMTRHRTPIRIWTRHDGVLKSYMSMLSPIKDTWMKKSLYNINPPSHKQNHHLVRHINSLMLNILNIFCKATKRKITL